MNKLKSYTRNIDILYYDSNEEVLISDKVDTKKDAFRGVWFSTVENIDIKGFDTVEEGKAQLDAVINKCLEYKINAVVFQVRPTNDALYESSINPYSRVLNKEKIEGKNPGFDVFGYFVSEANKNGIEVHAWMNPYRVTNRDLSKMEMTKEDYLNTLDDMNYAKKNPDLVLETRDHHLILDPASKEVQSYLVDTVMEIVNKYNITAIHIDDYFYPYDPIIDDKENEKLMNITPYMSLSEFRRYNVNEMIRKIHEALKGADRKVDFGISPFAVYRTNSKYFKRDGKEGGWYRGSNNFSGAFQCYESLYSDIYLWMKEGWIDYVTPQDYFPFDNYSTSEEGIITETVKYADVVRWWNDISIETKTKLYIGMATYRVGSKDVWLNPNEIIDQLKLNSTYSNVSGSIMFTYHDFTDTDNETKVKMRELLKEAWK